MKGDSTDDGNASDEDLDAMFPKSHPFFSDEAYDDDDDDDDSDMIPNEEETIRVLGFPPAFPRILRRPRGPGMFGAHPMAAVQVLVERATRHARRVYVGGLPAGITEQSIITCFDEAMAAIGGNTDEPGEAVIHVYISHDRRFAFVEMRSVEEASNALALDGIKLQGAPLKVRRPDDYDKNLAAGLGPSEPSESVKMAAFELLHAIECDRVGGLQGMVPLEKMTLQSTEFARRLYVEGFMPIVNEQMIATYFSQLMDSIGGNTAGPGDAVVNVSLDHGRKFAFIELRSVEEASNALALDGITFEGYPMKVRRPSDYNSSVAEALGPTQPSGYLNLAAVATLFGSAGGLANQEALQPKPEHESDLLQKQQPLDFMQRLVLEARAFTTKMVCLIHVVSLDELRNDDDYEEIMVNVTNEAAKYGTVLNVVIPRPNPNGEPTSELENIFLEYADTDEAAKARIALQGWKSGVNPVIARE